METEHIQEEKAARTWLILNISLPYISQISDQEEDIIIKWQVTMHLEMLFNHEDTILQFIKVWENLFSDFHGWGKVFCWKAEGSAFINRWSKEEIVDERKNEADNEKADGAPTDNYSVGKRINVEWNIGIRIYGGWGNWVYDGGNL